jgi:outer membrane protein OmpA-like peptidoglycan-associated protein
MKLNFISIIVIISLFSSQVAFSQKIKQKLADKYFDAEDYTTSLAMYEEISNGKKKTQHSLHRTAMCYAFLNKKEAAEKWYYELIQFGTDNPEVFYEYSKILRSNLKYIEADKNLNLYRLKSNLEPLVISDNYYIELKKDSNLRIVTNENFNSSNNDFAPAVINNILYFISGRSNNTNETNTIESFKIYELSSGSENPPALFHENTGNVAQEGPIAYNKFTNQYFITSNRIFGKFKSNQLKLFILDETRSWETATSFAFNSDEYSVGHAAFSNDGKTLYFVSNMPGGEGDSDIWYSLYEEGNWTKPVNLGSLINTRDKELFPYIAANGDLYFASSGHLGLGGLDIFKAEKSGNSFSPPLNVGYPINTNFDDASFVEIPNSSFAYFSSNRPNGKGEDDIYKIEFKKNLPENIDADILPITELPQEQDVQLTETKTNPNSNPSDSAIEKIVINTRTIYFDFNSYAISDNDKIFLSEMAIQLKANKNIKLLINGYTDSKGPEDVNQRLSIIRAKEVFNYLKSKEVTARQLDYRGYGESKPANRCSEGVECSDEEHKLNRRVEFVLTTN